MPLYVLVEWCPTTDAEYCVTQKGALNLLLDDLSVTSNSKENNAPSASTTSDNNSRVVNMHSTSIRQIYLSLWSVLCFMGMLAIIITFLLQRPFGSLDGDELRIGMPLTLSASNMGARLRKSRDNFGWETFSGGSGGGILNKNSAMLLTFVYAALAWTLSSE